MIAREGRFWGGGGFSERSPSSPDPFSRRAVGNRLELSFGLARPCELGAFSCFLGLWSRRLTEPPRPASVGIQPSCKVSARRGGGGDRKAARRAPSTASPPQRRNLLDEKQLITKRKRFYSPRQRTLPCLLPQKEGDHSLRGWRRIYSSPFTPWASRS